MRATFPWQVPFQTSQPRMTGTALEPQMSINGTETVVPAMNAKWALDASFVIYGEAMELAWQAFLAQMEGRIGTTLVPIWTRHRPKDRDGHEIVFERIASLAGHCNHYGHNGQTWEHFGFEAGPVATATLAAPAALRATTIKVNNGNTTGLRPGQYFSIGERSYRVQHHWVDNAGVTNLMIQPPLRQSFNNAALILDRPVCLMRFAEEPPELVYTPEGYGVVSCSFVEAEV